MWLLLLGPIFNRCWNSCAVLVFKADLCENVTARRSAASRPKLRLPAASPVLPRSVQRQLNLQFLLNSDPMTFCWFCVIFLEGALVWMLSAEPSLHTPMPCMRYSYTFLLRLNTRLLYFCIYEPVEVFRSRLHVRAVKQRVVVAHSLFWGTPCFLEPRQGCAKQWHHSWPSPVPTQILCFTALHSDTPRTVAREHFTSDARLW